MPLFHSDIRSPVLTATPSAPEAGTVKAYQKSNGIWYWMNNAGVETPLIVYGSNFNLFGSAGVTTVTTTAFATVLSGNTTVLPAGKYKVALAYSWNHASISNDFISRFSFGGVQLPVVGGGELHRQEPKDNVGTFSTTASSQKHLASATFFVDVATPSIKSVLFEIASESAGTESSVWGVSVEVIRVQ